LMVSNGSLCTVDLVASSGPELSALLQCGGIEWV
jgi:hypothetical protein